MPTNTKYSSFVTQIQVEKVISDPEFPWLISFPRTGSHWLRMLMELYFESPSLARIFYYHSAQEFTCYHRHDEDLQVTSVKNVIYLYRDPVSTLYSQMNYYNEKLDDEKRIQSWAELYARHLTKWLIEETFTSKKIIVSYEGLQNELHGEFSKICAFFDTKLNPDQIVKVASRVSKNELKIKTLHDLQVVNLSSNYLDQGLRFRKRHSRLIYELVFGNDSRLEKFKT